MARKRKKKKNSQAGDGVQPSDGGSGGNGEGEQRSAKKHSWKSTHGRDLKFLGVFVFLIGAYYVATQTDAMSDRFFPWYLRVNAQISGKILNFVGHDDVYVRDQMLGSKSFRMQIARGCDGIDPSALFVAAVLASPVAFRRKLPAVLIGVAILMVLNVVRIVTLYFTGLYFKKFFDMMHLDVWQAAFIILALVLWALWAHWIARHRVAQPHAT